MDVNVMMLGALGTSTNRADQVRNWEANAAAFAEMVDSFNWFGKLIGAVAGLLLVHRLQVSRPTYA